MSTSQPTESRKPPKLMLKSTKDALLIIRAVETTVFPRLVRRLTEQERLESIYSGAVIVYEEYESHIRRFTDTLIWSPSRIVGNYLVYREMKQHEPRPTSRAGSALPPQPASARSLARPRLNTVLDQNERERKKREQLYVGSLTHSSKFKLDGLIKRTFSLATQGVHFHVIGYYTYEDAMNEVFPTPSEHPDFANMEISQAYLADKSLYRIPPRTLKLPNGLLVYAGEGSDRPASPRSESASLEADRESPSASSSTRGTPGFPVSSYQVLPSVNTQPQEDSTNDQPPLRLLPSKGTWEANPAHNPSNFDSYNVKLDAAEYPFPATAPLHLTSSLTTISVPSFALPPTRPVPRLREVRQHPYSENQGRLHAHNFNTTCPQQSEFVPEPPFVSTARPDFSSVAHSPTHEHSLTWPTTQMSLDMGGFGVMQDQFSGEIVGNRRVRERTQISLPMGPHVAPQRYGYEVGPSGETVEYDPPARRYGGIEDTGTG